MFAHLELTSAIEVFWNGSDLNVLNKRNWGKNFTSLREGEKYTQTHTCTHPYTLIVLRRTLQADKNFWLPQFKKEKKKETFVVNPKSKYL